ncbi:Leucine-rich repeat-containing protein 9, partial [Desmophyllum pertusum]
MDPTLWRYCGKLSTPCCITFPNSAALWTPTWCESKALTDLARESSTVIVIISLQIEKEVEEEGKDCLHPSKKTRVPISPAAGDERKERTNEEKVNMAADTMMSKSCHDLLLFKILCWRITWGDHTKRLLEYLFLCGTQVYSNGNSEPIRVLEEGFRSAAVYQSLNEDGGVPLANRVSVSDKRKSGRSSEQEPSNEEAQISARLDMMVLPEYVLDLSISRRCEQYKFINRVVTADEQKEEIHDGRCFEHGSCYSFKTKYTLTSPGNTGPNSVDYSTLTCMTALKETDSQPFNELDGELKMKSRHMLILNVFPNATHFKTNNITTLDDGLKGCSRLKHLDVSWNRLTHPREELGIMRKHVITLHLSGHAEQSMAEALIFEDASARKAQEPEYLDGVQVTDEEMTAALKMAAASRPSSFAILAHARTDQSKPRTLSLVPTAQAILVSSRNKPVTLQDDDSQWFIKVTTVNLDNQHLGKLANMEQLENLRWASFNNNDLTKIEVRALSLCIHLEELSIENNCINKFEEFSKPSGTLYRQTTSSPTSGSIFNLKTIPSLLILDLCGNPLASAGRTTRLFVIYHLTSLKALDGLAVETSEGSLAKDTFGGRLTPDFIAERLGHSKLLRAKRTRLASQLAKNCGSGNQRCVHQLKKVLCLNHNHIECVVAKPKATSPANAPKRGVDVTLASEITIQRTSLQSSPILRFYTLDTMVSPIWRPCSCQGWTNLRALFLQGNDISKVEDLKDFKSSENLFWIEIRS